MKTERFRKFFVWNKSTTFVTDIYKVTEKFPNREIYGLTDQIRRAAISICLNIAEGSGAGSDLEFSRFVTIAKRSVFEVIAGLEIAINLGYIDRRSAEILMDNADELAAMLTGLVKKLRANSK